MPLRRAGGRQAGGWQQPQQQPAWRIRSKAAALAGVTPVTAADLCWRWLHKSLTSCLRNHPWCQGRRRTTSCCTHPACQHTQHSVSASAILPSAGAQAAVCLTLKWQEPCGQTAKEAERSVSVCLATTTCCRGDQPASHPTAARAPRLARPTADTPGCCPSSLWHVHSGTHPPMRSHNNSSRRPKRRRGRGGSAWLLVAALPSLLLSGKGWKQRRGEGEQAVLAWRSGRC